MIKISIIVPCYNQSEYLNESLHSILNQSFDDWECIIVNDGSTDSTKKIAETWVARDTRFSYTYQENKGLSAARNFGISQAKGIYILALDADDLISKDYVEQTLAEFDKNGNLKIVYARAEKFGTVDGIWNLPKFTFRGLLYSNMIYCSAVFKKSDWHDVGGYDTHLLYGIEDWEFWISLLKNGGEVCCLNFIGFYYRVKSESMITKMTEKNIENSKNYIYLKHASVYAQELGKLNFIKKSLRGKKYYLHNKKFIIDLIMSVYFGISLFTKITKSC